jgi:hypothetical protein
MLTQRYTSIKNKLWAAQARLSILPDNIGGEFTDVSGLPQAGVAALDTMPTRQVFLPLLYRQ